MHRKISCAQPWINLWDILKTFVSLEDCAAAFSMIKMAILEVNLRNEDEPRNLDGLKRKDYHKIGNDPNEEDEHKMKTTPKMKCNI